MMHKREKKLFHTFINIYVSSIEDRVKRIEYQVLYDMQHAISQFTCQHQPPPTTQNPSLTPHYRKPPTHIPHLHPTFHHPHQNIPSLTTHQ